MRSQRREGCSSKAKLMLASLLELPPPLLLVTEKLLLRRRKSLRKCIQRQGIKAVALSAESACRFEDKRVVQGTNGKQPPPIQRQIKEGTK